MTDIPRCECGAFDWLYEAETGNSRKCRACGRLVMLPRRKPW